MTNQQMQYAYWQRMRQQQVYRAYAAGAAQKKNSYDKLAKVSDSYFLNYLEYSPKNIGSQKAADYLKSLEPALSPGRCTGVYDKRTGKALRQLDWYFNNEAEFIVKMNADPDKQVFGSIGVTAASPKMTKDVARRMIETGEYYEYFDVLPFFTVDGVNDQGIFAQSNVVDKNGIDININGGKPEMTDCCTVMIVRYILDKFSQADMADKDAVKAKIKNNLHIFGTSKLGGYNPHILVVCHERRKSYVIEFTAEDVIVNEFPIMTNFRTIKSNLSAISMTTDYGVDWDEIEQNGIGLERWATCAKLLNDKTGSYDDFKWLREQLDYTHAYDRPFQKNVTWLTDNLSGDLTVADAKECHNSEISQEFQEALDGYKALYVARSRDTIEQSKQTWITTHSAIYDLVSLSCSIKSQMSTTEETCWNVLSDGTITEVEYEGLCFTAQENGSSVKLQNVAGDYKTSTDGKSWTDYVLGTPIPLNEGDKVYFAAKGENATCWNGNDGRKFVMAGKIAASGSIQGLLKADCSKTNAPAHCYQNMFHSCASLASSPELPAVELADNCYQSMFLSCTQIKQAPALPATTLADGCYQYMFYECSSLTAATELPAGQLAPHCYDTMLKNCVSLSAGPALSGETLREYCYANMFHGCTSLTAAPALQSAALADNCYMGMFRDCSALKISEDEEGGTVVLDLPSETAQKDEWNSDMFTGTGGSFTGDPSVGKTYRCY